MPSMKPFAAIVLGAVLLLGSMLAAAGPQSGFTAPAYDIIQLPLAPAAINQEGEVAGALIDEQAGSKAAVWSEKTGMRVLGSLPDVPNGRAVAINSEGVVAGYATSFSSQASRAFIYRRGQLRELPHGTRVYAIDKNGAVVGESYAPGQSGPTIWRDAIPTVIPNCCGGAARGIGNDGLVVGDIYDKQGRYHAFTWDGKHPPRLLPFPDDASTVRAINGLGHLVVYTPTGYILMRGSTLTRIGAADVAGLALNDRDQVVGSYGPNPFAPKAFVWDEQHGRIDLNDAIPPNSGWKLERAVAINNRGQIVGTGDFRHRDDTGFLLQPRKPR